MSRYLIVATVDGVWVQYVNQEFDNKEVALDLTIAIRVYMPVKAPAFRCFVIRTDDLQNIAGKSGDIDVCHGVIAYGSRNTFII